MVEIFSICVGRVIALAAIKRKYKGTLAAASFTSIVLRVKEASGRVGLLGRGRRSEVDWRRVGGLGVVAVLVIRAGARVALLALGRAMLIALAGAGLVYAS